MRINNNIMAMNTHRQYAINNDNLAKATQRLSSGYRINNAADDAAGLAISEKMRAQIRGLNMAAKNSQDAISLVQTAEGALEETESILQRMRELAVQSASDTNQQIDRDALDAEFQQLIKELDDIASKADFNGTTLLDGSLKAGFEVTSSALPVNANETTGFDKLFAALPGITGLDADTYEITIVAATDAGDPGGMESPRAVVLTGAGATYRIASNATGDGAVFNATDGETANVQVWNDVDNQWNTIGTFQVSAEVAAEINGAEIADDDDVTMTIADQTDLNAVINGLSFESSDVGPVAGTYTVAYDTTGNGKITFTKDADVYTVTLAADKETYDLVDNEGKSVGKITVKAEVATALGKLTTAGALGALSVNFEESKAITIQTGSNEGDTLAISIGDMSSTGLKVDTCSISSRDGAASAITIVGNAINSVSTQRAHLGALQNRLEHKINNLNTSAENLQAAESRIRDIDMAKEMTQFTQTSILVQAATSMLAQANNAPQNVLSLLR